MKILIVSPFFPYPPDNGGAIRIYNLIKHLSGLHDITLLCYIHEDQCSLLDQLSPYCRIITLPLPESTRSWKCHARYLFSKFPYSLVYIDQQFKEKLKEVSRDSWDIIQFEFLALAHYVNVLPESAKKVVVEHYIALESRKRLMKLWKAGLKKWYYFWELWKIRNYERRIFNRFDLCLVTNDDHAGKLRDWKIGARIEVSPNGVDTDYFKPLKENSFGQNGDRHSTLVYMGAFHLEPANIDGLTYLLDEILPYIEKGIPDVHIEIIGHGLSHDFRYRYRSDKIRIHGYVEDIRPILGKAHAFLIPLRGGSGTKIRILTAMSMAVPVVATSIAASGIDVEPDMHLLIGDSPQMFAAQTIRILKDRELNRRIGFAGLDLVKERYSWKRIAGDLNGLFHSI